MLQVMQSIIPWSSNESCSNIFRQADSTLILLPDICSGRQTVISHLQNGKCVVSLNSLDPRHTLFYTAWVPDKTKKCSMKQYSSVNAFQHPPMKLSPSVKPAHYRTGSSLEKSAHDWDYNIHKSMQVFKDYTFGYTLLHLAIKNQTVDGQTLCMHAMDLANPSTSASLLTTTQVSTLRSLWTSHSKYGYSYMNRSCPFGNICLRRDDIETKACHGRCSNPD